MKRWSYWFATLAGAAAGGMVAAALAGAAKWQKASLAAFADLNERAHDALPGEFDPAELSALPLPVQRFFQFALPAGGAPVRTASVRQVGLFRLGGIGSAWSPFCAVERFTSGPPGFVWDARIFIAPLIEICVRDSYVNGKGAMEARIASLIPAAKQSDRPELAAGALHRYLAEAVWLPTALLPSRGVKWEAIDDSTARATIADGETAVSLDFRFGDRGEIVSAFTPARYRDVGGIGVPTPWTCEYDRYALVDGLMIPMRGVVSWILPEGPLAYCKLRLRHIAYDERQKTNARLAVTGLIAIDKILRSAPQRRGGSPIRTGSVSTAPERIT